MCSLWPHSGVICYSRWSWGWVKSPCIQKACQYNTQRSVSESQGTLRKRKLGVGSRLQCFVANHSRCEKKTKTWHICPYRHTRGTACTQHSNRVKEIMGECEWCHKQLLSANRKGTIFSPLDWFWESSWQSQIRNNHQNSSCLGENALFGIHTANINTVLVSISMLTCSTPSKSCSLHTYIMTAWTAITS